MALEPYDLHTLQELVRDALQRSRRRHETWRALEALHRTGESGPVQGVPDVISERYPDLSVSSINLILPKTEMLIATAMGRDPGFVVEAYSGGAGADVGSRIGKELLTYWWKRLEGTRLLRDMVRDAIVLGNGFCKIGWRFEAEEKERSEDEVRQELTELVEAERRMALLEDREAREADELLDLVDMRSSEVVADEPFMEYVAPYDLFVPPTARRLNEARWIAQRVRVPFDEAANNPAFKNTDDLEPSERSDYAHRRGDDERLRQASEAGASEEDPFAEVTLWEFYDMRTRKLTVCQLEADKALYRDDFPFAHRHSPFVHLRNHNDGGQRFWSFGDLENIAAIQSDFNEFIFEQLDNAKRSGAKHFIDKNANSPKVQKALEDPRTDVVIPIDLENKAIEEVIQSFQRSATSPEVFQASGDLKALMDQVLGLNVFESGGTGPDRMSATAAAVVDGTSNQRSQTKQKQVEDAAEEMGLRLLLLSQEFLDTETALQVSGGGGSQEWLQVSRDDLVGEYGVRVEAGSTRGTNPQTRQRRAIEVMTQIIPMLKEDGYDTHPVWQEALKDYGLDPEKLLRKPEPQPQPQAAPPGMAEALGMARGGGQPPAQPPSQAAVGLSPGGTGGGQGGPPQGPAPGAAQATQARGREAI